MTHPPPGTPEYWATVQPEAAAVVAADASLTYGQWNDQADRLASALHDAGVRAGDRIAVRMRLRPEWFVINRAIAKLGCAQVALNWRLTAAESRHILQDSGARVVCCDDEDPRALLDGWAYLPLDMLLTVGQDSGSPGQRLEDLSVHGRPEPRIGPPRTPLILYTSGTTGKPRGVSPAAAAPADPREAAAYAASVQASPPTPPGSRALLTLPLHHGAGPNAARAVHAGGGSVHLLDPYDAESVLALVERHQITHWVAVPTMLLRIRALPEETSRHYDISSLQAVSLGAAPASPSLKEWAIRFFGSGVLWEGYGTTEVGMVSSIAPADQLRKPGSSGRAFDAVRIRIVDDDWRELPPNRTGEIAVHTPVTITRYLGGPALDSDVLSADGFFRTGDLGHLDEDGYLFITDRRKDMIVAGGTNIYPAEIEAVLTEHPAVLDCAVIGIPHDDFGEQPLALVELRAGAELTSDDLIAFAAGRLAPYKLPRGVRFVPELPRNPVGKVLKRELREPYWQGRSRNI